MHGQMSSNSGMWTMHAWKHRFGCPVRIDLQCACRLRIRAYVHAAAGRYVVRMLQQMIERLGSIDGWRVLAMQGRRLMRSRDASSSNSSTFISSFRFGCR